MTGPTYEPWEQGRVAYNAYGDYVGWRTVSGNPMPPWNEQDERLRNAWIATAHAVIADARWHEEIWPGSVPHDP